MNKKNQVSVTITLDTENLENLKKKTNTVKNKVALCVAVENTLKGGAIRSEMIPAMIMLEEGVTKLINGIPQKDVEKKNDTIVEVNERMERIWQILSQN